MERWREGGEKGWDGWISLRNTIQGSTAMQTHAFARAATRSKGNSRQTETRQQLVPLRCTHACENHEILESASSRQSTRSGDTPVANASGPDTRRKSNTKRLRERVQSMATILRVWRVVVEHTAGNLSEHSRYWAGTRNELIFSPGS